MWLPVFLGLFCLELSSCSVSATAEATISSVVEDKNWKETWVAPKKIVETFPYYVQGFDIEKRPIFTFEVGHWPIRSWVEKGGKDLEDLEKHLQQLFYRMEQGPKLFFNESEMGAHDTVVICDWADYNILQVLHGPTIQFMLHHFGAFQTIQNSLAYGFYVNVNAVAAQFLSIAKPVLGSALERVEILGTSKKVWLPKILRTIQRDQIPPKYGGDNVNFKPAYNYG